MQQETLRQYCLRNKMADINVRLSDEERQKCEVWTRVMGYHRPVDAFNKGKKAEYYERVYFKEENQKKD